MTKVYQWRFTVKGHAYSWTTVDEDHFNYLRDNRFFGKGSTDGFVFEGRILTVEFIEEL